MASDNPTLDAWFLSFDIPNDGSLYRKVGVGQEVSGEQYFCRVGPSIRPLCRARAWAFKLTHGRQMRATHDGDPA